ncbi:MAG: tetratricopeptide repeat protein [Micropepsaceae bacterium]
MDFKTIYLAPGRLFAELQYLFPKEGQIFASARRRESPLAIAIYATIAWGCAILFALYLVVQAQSQSNRQPAAASSNTDNAIAGRPTTVANLSLSDQPEPPPAPSSYTPEATAPRTEAVFENSGRIDPREMSSMVDDLLNATRSRDDAILKEFAQRQAATLPSFAPPSQAAIEANAEGLTLIQGKLYRAAMTEFGRATALASDFSEAWQNLAFACLRSEDLDCALVAAKASLALTPTDANNWVLLAETLARRGDTDGAEAGFAAVLTFAKNRDSTANFLKQLEVDTDSPAVAAAIRANLETTGGTEHDLGPNVIEPPAMAVGDSPQRANGERALELRFEANLPDAAAGKASSGTVKARATIAPNGYVTYCDPLSEMPSGLGFAEAACYALYQWKFEEATKSTQQIVTIEIGRR